MAGLQKIEVRTIEAAKETLERQSVVSLLDVFLGMKLLHISHVRAWERGEVLYLEEKIQGAPHKIKYILKCFQKWAQEEGLKSHKVVYWQHTKGPRKMLQFTAAKNPHLEQMYRTHYTRPLLEEGQQKEAHLKSVDGPEFFRTLTSRP